MTKRATSVLAMGRQEADAEPAAGFWFHDADKLLAAVLRNAAGNQQFAQRVALAIGSWAQGKPAIKATLEEAMKAVQPGRGRTPYWQHVMLLHELDILVEGRKMGQEKALEKLGQEVWNLSLERMKKKLSEARKQVRPEDQKP